MESALAPAGKLLGARRAQQNALAFEDEGVGLSE
jgi:hypothetical protein